MTPFLTFLTPSRWDRPKCREACLAQVHKASQGVRIQHLVEIDHHCEGIGAMYTRMPQFAHAIRGEYVHILADDDCLQDGAPRELQVFAEQWGYPPVIIVNVIKGALLLPIDPHGPPVEGRIDLGCVVTRADVWKQHVQDYGARYEGDYDHVSALFKAGHKFLYKPEGLFLWGDVMRGRPE